VKFKKYVISSFIVVFISTMVLEAFARYYLGLGTPYLFDVHPRIEYMLKKNQDVYRFGNHIIVNEYGMRSKPFKANNDKNNETRIMVFGDSVVNGGSLTDHSELATTILANEYKKPNGNTIVGNISAGSWGPGNWLAYAQEYGFFEADVVVLVISSHDYVDNPTYQTLNESTHPTVNPFSAFTEGLVRYLPRYLPNWFSSKKVVGVLEDKDKDKGLKDLLSFLKLAQRNAVTVMVLQHWEKDEIARGYANAGNQAIKDICKTIGILPISLEPYFRQFIQNGGDPYRDDIHPNQMGQNLIAKAIIANMPRN
jgi:lysophospholipase L1-like esterase